MRNLVAALFALMLVIPGLVWSQEAPEEFVQGKNYQLLSFPVHTRNAEKIEVVELFWYGCPHCYHFEPMLHAWLKSLPEDVDFWRSPAVFGKQWEVHAQTFYALEALGMLEKVHQPLFDALARDHRSLNTPDAVAEFLGQLGVNEADFKKSYNSFSVRGKVEQAIARGRSYRATGVPSLVVNGKYLVDASMAGGMDKMLKVVDFLIAKERAQKSSS